MSGSIWYSSRALRNVANTFSKLQTFAAGILIKDNQAAAFGDDSDYSLMYSSTNDTLQIVDGSTVDTNIRAEIDSSGNIDFSSDIDIAGTLSNKDPLRQVNLLTNSGFGVWSNSTLENVGTQITLTDVTNGICLTADTQDLVIGKLFRFDSGDFSGNVYEVTAVTEDVSFTVHDTSITDTGSPGTGYEVTPGCVAANTKAMDGWRKESDVDILREHNGTNTKDGSFYSCKIIGGGAAPDLLWPIIFDKETVYKKFSGRTISFGIWVKTDAASQIRLRSDDGVTSVYSSYNTGTDWEWLELTKDVSPANTKFWVGLIITNTKTVYVSQPMLVFGSSIGEGNYVAPQGEILYLEDSFALTDYSGTQTISANADINLEAQSDGKIPKGVKAIYLRLMGTCATTESYLQIEDGSLNFGLRLYNMVSGIKNAATGWSPCGFNGDVAIARDATFTDVTIVIMGVQL